MFYSPSKETPLEVVVEPMIFLTDTKRHLICYPYSIENLHRMAESLGINRCWFHKNHYDIPKRRKDEIEEQCYIVSTKMIVEIIKDKEYIFETMPA
jgi:hypothetical protein